MRVGEGVFVVVAFRVFWVVFWIRRVFLAPLGGGGGDGEVIPIFEYYRDDGSTGAGVD